MKYLHYLLLGVLFSCQSNPGSAALQTNESTSVSEEATLRCGIENVNEYVSLLKGKKVGLVVNQSAIFSNRVHLVDSLLNLGIEVKAIFGPEHGFRGEADAGAKIVDDKDPKTGLPVYSLYGANRKPKAEHLKNIDVMVFDIQDVGVRYFTYPSTLHLVMEACAENGKSIVLLDRPNPNGDYVDGPVLDTRFSSFVGMNPVPVVHGLTMGELGKMINGEKWLSGGKQVELQVIKCNNYTHQTRYELPIKPSPNLPNFQSVRLYPSICLFEPTVISVGRGTDTQFQVIGGVESTYGPYKFIPVDKPGAQNPPNEGKQCYGYDLREVDTYQERFTLKYVIDLYNKTKDKSKFFTSASFFDKLAGTDMIRKMIIDGKSETEIRAAFTPELEAFKVKRRNYLLYPDTAN